MGFTLPLSNQMSVIHPVWTAETMLKTLRLERDSGADVAGNEKNVREG